MPRFPEIRVDGWGRVGPGFGMGFGCGIGAGIGMVGGFGVGFGLPGLQLGGGVGAGCGIGIGYGYGIGVGKAYDSKGHYSNITGHGSIRRFLRRYNNSSLGATEFGSLIEDISKSVHDTVSGLVGHNGKSKK